MAKGLATVLGIVLLMIGLWGMGGGEDDHQMLVFGVNGGHNVIHILSGAAALATAMLGERPAMIYCLAFGSIYGLVSVLGFFQVPAVVRMLNLNMPDNFLHLAIAVICLWVGGQSKGK
jgi:ammonia channel protein AmtB